MSFTIVVPKANTKFLIGQTVDFEGTLDEGTTRVEVIAEDRFVLPTVTLRPGKWLLTHRFNTAGNRKLTCRCFDKDDTETGNLTVMVVIQAPAQPPNFGEFVKIPSGINPGVTKARQATMIEVFGKPGVLTEDCSPITNAELKNKLITHDVGPFSVTGLKPAVEALERIFTKVEQQEPELYKQVSTAGMLCCRRIRRPPNKPPSKQFSNHSWGTAVDLKIKGALDPRGDGKTQRGLLILAPFFNAERFFWGAGFAGKDEDSMHFEASNELVLDWQDKGIV